MKPNKETYRLAFILYLLPLINEKVPNPSANKIDDYHKKLFGKDYKLKAVSGKQVMRIINNEDDTRIKTKDDTLSKLGRVYGGDITSCDIFEEKYNDKKKRRYNKDIVEYVKEANKYLSPSPQKYSSRDNSAFLGIWKGHSTEKLYTTIENNESVEKKKFIEYKISFEMNAKKTSEVIGTIEIFYHNHPIKSHQHQTFTFFGKVISNSLLFIEYKNVNSSAFHFGSILFKLNAIGDTLTGAFVGYGITAEQIVHGEVTVRKALSTHS